MRAVRRLAVPLIGWAVLAAACSTTEPPAEGPEGGDDALVTRVIDGDTVEARFRGRIVDVRLIGIDTPESVAPGQPVECYALAASRFTTKELEGRSVRLELDVERLDRYGRTLAYVWIDGELFNETLVREGFAVVTTYPPNVRYVDRFLDAQREARSQGRGLWGRCEADQVTGSSAIAGMTRSVFRA